MNFKLGLICNKICGNNFYTLRKIQSNVLDKIIFPLVTICSIYTLIYFIKSEK